MVNHLKSGQIPNVSAFWDGRKIIIISPSPPSKPGKSNAPKPPGACARARYGEAAAQPHSGQGQGDHSQQLGVLGWATHGEATRDLMGGGFSEYSLWDILYQRIEYIYIHYIYIYIYT